MMGLSIQITLQIVASNNVALARKLLRFSPGARAHLQVEHGVVVFQQPGAFSLAFDKLRQAFFEHKIAKEAWRSWSSNGRAEGLIRVARPWSPLGKLIQLAYIFISIDGGAAQPPEWPAVALAEH